MPSSMPLAAFWTPPRPGWLAHPTVARTMAQRAVDYCIWPDCHTVLVRAVDAFCIWCKIDSAIN